MWLLTARRTVSSILLLIFLCSHVNNTNAYRPVVLVHGVLADAASLFYLRDYVAKAHPDTQITDVDLFSSGLSLVDMWTQVNVIGNIVRNVSDNCGPDGFHILGDSQGGILVRGIVQKFKLNVHTFIALSSPLNGQFGDDALKWFPGWAKEDLHYLLYTPLGQRFSVGGYWRDPHQLPDYKKHNIFLPVLNNETTSSQQHDSNQMRANFLQLQRLVLIGGPDDGTITPYQSAFFGTYDSEEQVVPIEEQEIYQNDYFGLRTLAEERQAVIVHNISGVHHVDWQVTDSVIENAILPYLD